MLASDVVLTTSRVVFWPKSGQVLLEDRYIASAKTAGLLIKGSVIQSLSLQCLKGKPLDLKWPSKAASSVYQCVSEWMNVASIFKAF